MTMVTAGILGVLAGWFIPGWAEKIAKYKRAKKGAALESDGRFTSLPVKLGCLLVNGACFFFCGMLAGNVLQAALIAVLILDSILIAIIDLRINIIPNELVLVMAVLGMAFRITSFGISSVGSSIAAMFAVIFVFTILGNFLGLHTIGAGDVKLAGAMGLSLGWPYIMIGMAGMSAVLLVVCGIGLLLKKMTLKSMIAFAPFMMAGNILAFWIILLNI